MLQELLEEDMAKATKSVRILKFRSLRLPISPNLLVPILPYSLLFFAIPCYEVHELYEPTRLTLLIHFVSLMIFFTFPLS